MHDHENPLPALIVTLRSMLVSDIEGAVDALISAARETNGTANIPAPECQTDYYIRAHNIMATDATADALVAGWCDQAELRLSTGQRLEIAEALLRSGCPLSEAETRKACTYIIANTREIMPRSIASGVLSALDRAGVAA